MSKFKVALLVSAAWFVGILFANIVDRSDNSGDVAMLEDQLIACQKLASELDNVYIIANSQYDAAVNTLAVFVTGEISYDQLLIEANKIGTVKKQNDNDYSALKRSDCYKVK